jgi:hypothetical protein
MKKLEWSKFAISKPEDIAKSDCIEVTKEDKPVGIFIVGAIGEMRERILNLGGMIDAGK